MSNLSDNELDKLSQEAAENFEPADSGQAWNKLEQLLDKHLGKPAPVPRAIRLGTALMYPGALVIAIVASYFITKAKKNKHNSTLTVSATTHPRQSAQSDSGKNIARINGFPTESSNGKSAVIASTSPSSASQPDQPGSEQKRDRLTSGSRSSTESSNPGHDERMNSPKTQIRNRIQSENRDKNATVNATLPKYKVQGERLGTSSGSGNNQPPNDEPLNRTHELQPTSILKGIAATSETEGHSGVNKNAHNKSRFSSGPAPAETLTSKLPSKSIATKESGNLASNEGTAEKNGRQNQNQAEDHNAIVEDAQSTGTGKADLAEDPKAVLMPGTSKAGPGSIFAVSDAGIRSVNASTRVALIPDRPTHRTAFVNRSLQFGILFAPDFSEVKHIYQNNRLGNDLGVALSYQLLSRLSINSGIVFSKKYYQANEQGFHAPPGTVNGNLDIKFVDGSANVIDVPLNIRFNYFSEQSTTFFINGGFSSYFITKQDLHLYCESNSNNNLRYAVWQPPRIQPENNSYLFSVVNLSTGFETSLGENFSFQFEPYVKLPIRGIGLGKVDLNSYGINFSLKYAPVLSRGRR
ncbi:MAG TPA: hypothetical protein VKR32_01470 [Puia sp.]|nr:hypothetical protein [Puia sp.]